MEVRHISHDIFKPFSRLVEDYLNLNLEKTGLYRHHFSIANVQEYAQSRKFDDDDRKTLHSVIKGQYNASDISIDGEVKKNLDSLLLRNTFTITTGHQLCLFTGPLYFILKILQAIKLADKLNESDKDHNYVPVFWMASEDHDFAEINHAHLFGKKLQWDSDQTGAVGKFSLNDIDSCLSQVNEVLGESDNAQELKRIFNDSYSENYDLSVATRKLVHQLFAKRGLIILDADDKDLKEMFIPQFSQEVEESVVFNESAQSIEKFDKSHKIQVNPREVNMFYLQKGERSLIEKSGDNFKLKDGDKSWSKNEILKEIEEHPDKFSPNVVLRPMYQERILPNLCYIGGAAEISYWLQLKSSFEKFDLEFPLLNLRNSVFWLDRGKEKKLAKLELKAEDLFLDEQEISRKLMNYEEVEEQLKFDFSRVNQVFDEIAEKISDTDPTLNPVVKGESKKIQNQLEQLNKRLIKAIKSRNEEKMNSYWNLHEKVFPGGNLHERYDNFAPYFLSYNWSFFDTIYNAIDPEDSRLILVEDI